MAEAGEGKDSSVRNWHQLRGDTQHSNHSIFTQVGMGALLEKNVSLLSYERRHHYEQISHAYLVNQDNRLPGRRDIEDAPEALIQTFWGRSKLT
jgi:hypothetical protein